MCCGNEEHSGIMVSMSRGAGTCVGTVAAAGRKVTGVVTNGLKTVGHLLVRPGNNSPEPGCVKPEPIEKPVAATEQERTAPSTQVAIAEPAEQAGIRAKEQPSKVISKGRMPDSSAVTVKQIQAAVFDKETDKILLVKAISDIADNEVAMRVDAVKIMAGVHHELSVQALIVQAASDTSAKVRQECVKALTAMEMKEGLPAIEKALTDPAGSVRLAAVWGLYRLTGIESSPALLNMLSDEDEEVRRRTATCIGWLGHEELADRLTPLLDDSNVLVRRAAVEAMSSLGNKQVVLSMIGHLKDPDRTTGKMILAAIEKITGKKMGRFTPKNETDMDRLVARWHEWWKEEFLG